MLDRSSPVKISDSYFRITEFKNISRASWSTHRSEVVLHITIYPIESNSSEKCYINVTGIPKFIEIYPIMQINAYKVAPRFRLKEITPVFFVNNKLNQTHKPYQLLVALVTTSWRSAQENCTTRGMDLLTLDSLAQWQSLMEHTHHVYQQYHFTFWKSHIVFIGNKKHSRFMVSFSK